MPDLTQYVAKLQEKLNAAEVELAAQTEPEDIARCQEKVDKLTAKKARVEAR